MKIAVASSGLGHVARGIETWADDLGTALHGAGVETILFKGGGPARRPFERVICCAQRDQRLAQWLHRLSPRFAWRWGFGSPYQIEQTTFAWRLIPQLRRERIDLVHLQDSWLASLLHRAHQRGQHPAAVILAHGTEEPLPFLQQFDHLQELAPYYLEQDRQTAGVGAGWFAIPNFVDVDRFAPAIEPFPRERLGIAPDAFLVLTVAAIKRTHKRVDAAVEAVARLRQRHPERSIHLLVAGARERETDEVIDFGKRQLGASVTFLENFDRAQMPGLFRCADVLLHAALKEMMPIALLEATASGLPIIAHRWPVIEWIVGEGGACVDAASPDALAGAMEACLDPSYRQQKSAQARQRALATFSTAVVIPQILAMYREVLAVESENSK